VIPLAGIVLAAALSASPPPAVAPAGRSFLEARVDAIPEARLLAGDPKELFAERRQHAAARYQIERRALLVGSILVPAFVLFRLWGSGLCGRLRASLSRTVPPSMLSFTFGLVLIGGGWVAAMPFSFLDYRLSRLYGLTRAAPAAWLGSWLVQAIIATVLLSLVGSAILWLVDRTRLWYLYAAAGVVVATVALAWADPVAISPLTQSDRPIARHSLPFLTQQAIAKAHLAVPLYEGGVPRTGLAAGVEGVGGTTRIVLADYVIASASAREKSFIILRELGHVATGDPFRGALVFASFGILTLAIAVAIADRVPFRPEDDPLSRLGLVGASALVFSMIVWLPTAAYFRSRDLAADRYAFALTGDRAAAVRSIVRTSDELLIPVCPAIDWSFPDVHASPGRRIAAILGTPDACEAR
jgi:Zn-dependent protease with chaperone function